MSNTNINKKLFNLQREIGSISKDTTNPFYKSKYFDINSLISQLDPYLDKYGLILFQPVNIDFETGIEFVETFLECNETSQRSPISRKKLPNLNDPQKEGSAITYYRRYTLASLLGLQAEDDDANATVKRKPQYNKSTMGINHPEFQRAVEHVSSGKPIASIQARYNLTKEALEQLNKLNK